MAGSKFSSKRIYLRKLEVSDINDHYLSFYSHKELTQYMYQTPRTVTQDDLIQELKSGNETGQYHMYGVFDLSNDQCIGNIRVGHMNVQHKISDLAIFIGNPEYLGKGFATEAIELGNRLCFEQYDFRKLHGGMFQANMASIKAYLKTGWVIEGKLKGQYWVDGKPMDRICVACFNPKYFTDAFRGEMKKNSDQILKDLQ
jgi:[ribosomal protein S5]-alanine N-acetyltransferase